MSLEQDRPAYGSNAPRSYDTSSGNDFQGPSSGNSASNDDTSRRLEAALHSPYGIDKLLNRLKQSIFSAREFSGFLRERCSLEDRHAQGYKKLVRNTIESVRRTEARQGSYARHLDESLKVNDRIADNGLALASSLHTMSEELRDVAENAEKGRKHWKHATIDAEKRLSEAETAQQKAKDRYNAAAEQYDRVRTGEKQGPKFGLKGKSPAQQEEALKEKADSLDTEYASKFEVAQSSRREFEKTTRPEIVRALKELIDECDAAVAMQMAKLASVSEKNVVSNGMAIAPIKTAGSDYEARGLRQIARDVDDRKDFSDYMLDGVEPPPQFKGRSRRNTDAEIIHTPVQRTDTVETPYSATQANTESRPPQLPQIGGSDSFSRSFEAERPGQQKLNQSRNSYLGGPSDALSSNPTHQSQQTGVTRDPAPSLPVGRGVPTGPSLPAYDRAQASPTDNVKNFDNSGFNGNQGQYRQDTGAGRGRPSMDNSTFDRSQGPARQDTMPPSIGRGQSTIPGAFPDHSEEPLRQDTHPTFGGRGQTTATESFADRSQGPTRQDTHPSLSSHAQTTASDSFADRAQGPLRQDNNQGFTGRGQSTASDSFTDRNQGPLRQDTGPSFAGRGQSSVSESFSDRNQGPLRQDTAPLGGGRGQPFAGTTATHGERDQGFNTNYPQQSSMGTGYNETGKTQSPIDSTGFRQGQGAQGMGQAGAGATTGPTGRSILPSQQQSRAQQQPQRPTLPPTRPVFGMHLDELFRRDGSAVPIIVFQCIQAVDMYGLASEGIYRVSGSAPLVHQLKSEFDHDSNLVNLTDREVYNHDIHTVATLLKNFLRDMPDPLLTASAYHSFIQAARYEDNIMRRDALHQYINSLPDPNYATLRVLTLHLHRIAMNSDVNKMDLRNLAIVFGPTVMGGGNMADSGLQMKVMETILHHTHDIFDPDE